MAVRPMAKASSFAQTHPGKRGLKATPGRSPTNCRACSEPPVPAIVNCRFAYQLLERCGVAPSIGGVLRQARVVRRLSAGDAARAAGISAAYLNRLENDA